MKNEYGAVLDSNGYAPSILMRKPDRCHICGRRDLPLQRHEVFHGDPNRERSKKYGLWINVCYACHTVIHNGNGELDKCLKREGEEEALKHYKWTAADFILKFGKNYL